MSVIENKRLASDLDADERTAADGQVKRIAGSRRFAQSDKAKRLLKHIVEEALAGREGDLKEYSIALAVYGKGQDFDPSTDRFVSMAAGALRKKLDEYYANEGRNDRCFITIPTGGFVPEFEFVTDPEPVAIPPTPAVPPDAPEDAEVAAKWRSRLTMVLAAVATVAFPSGPRGSCSGSVAICTGVPTDNNCTRADPECRRLGWGQVQETPRSRLYCSGSVVDLAGNSVTVGCRLWPGC